MRAVYPLPQARHSQRHYKLDKAGEMAGKLDRIMGGTFTSKRLQYAPPGPDQIAEIREYTAPISIRP